MPHAGIYCRAFGGSSQIYLDKFIHNLCCDYFRLLNTQTHVLKSTYCHSDGHMHPTLVWVLLTCVTKAFQQIFMVNQSSI